MIYEPVRGLLQSLIVVGLVFGLVDLRTLVDVDKRADPTKQTKEKKKRKRSSKKVVKKKVVKKTVRRPPVNLTMSMVNKVLKNGAAGLQDQLCHG